jgi:pyrroloquinoline quinone (PQQ) biosynthesis protein C
MTAAGELVVTAAGRIEAALVRGAAPSEVALAAEALAELARRATPEDEAAHAAYHALLWNLHERLDPRTQATRRWLCQAAYEVEEARILAAHADDPSFDVADPSPDALRERILAMHEQRSGLRHPLSIHLFEAAPAHRDVLVYLEHHWYRSRGFHRELTELSLSLALPDAQGIVANLHDELGEGHAGRSHPELLQRLLVHLGVPCRFDARPPWVEALAYLNNRIRCARSGEPAWGLAVLFSLEHGTPATHGSILALLRRMGVPEPLCEFHRLHALGDAAHAEVILALVLRRVVTPSARRALLVSLHHHRALGLRYFDRIWREIRPPEAWDDHVDHG